jgi:hypothetical protein
MSREFQVRQQLGFVNGRHCLNGLDLVEVEQQPQQHVQQSHVTATFDPLGRWPAMARMCPKGAPGRPPTRRLNFTVGKASVVFSDPSGQAVLRATRFAKASSANSYQASARSWNFCRSPAHPAQVQYVVPDRSQTGRSRNRGSGGPAQNVRDARGTRLRKKGYRRGPLVSNGFVCKIATNLLNGGSRDAAAPVAARQPRGRRLSCPGEKVRGAG